jgi:hypothetical protein
MNEAIKKPSTKPSTINLTQQWHRHHCQSPSKPLHCWQIAFRWFAGAPTAIVAQKTSQFLLYRCLNISFFPLFKGDLEDNLLEWIDKILFDQLVL